MGRLAKKFFVTATFSPFSRAFLSSQRFSSFIFLTALLNTLPSVLTLYSGYDIFRYFNVCSASDFSCTLQVYSAATVLLALVILCTILAVKNSLFTDSERCFIKMNNSCSYLVPPEQPSMGFLSTGQTEPKFYWVSIIHLITNTLHVNHHQFCFMH